jgi:hypothetical protein
MKSRLLWMFFLPLIALSASCSGQSASDQERASSAAPADSTPPVGQTAAQVPVISTRTYVGGNAKVTVTGSFQIDADIPINTKASLSDGEMTWLQYGVSGSVPPEALVTVSTQEVGIAVGRDKQSATIGAADCTGKMDVAAKLITGHYTCPGVTSYDARTGSMGKVNIEVTFSAQS